jgi:transglutaminase-like putative cysteine protease
MTLLERLKRVNAPGPPEESVALRVAIIVSVLAASLAVLAQGVGGPALRLAMVVGVPGAFWFSHRGRHRTRFWLKVALAVGVMVAFGAFLADLGEVDSASLASAQAPLAELFCWVQLLHAFDVPARRDLMFSLVSSQVLMAVAGTMSVSMGLLPYLLVWGVAAAASLALSYRSELSELPSLAGPSQPKLEPLDQLRRLASPLALSMAVVVAVGAGAFVLLPPAGQARALTFPRQLERSVPVPDIGGLSNPSLGEADPGGSQDGTSKGRASFGYFGFSNSLDTAVRGRPDDSLVMRVRSSRPDFWRGQTFDVWDGRRWTLSSERSGVLTGYAPLEIPRVAGEERLLRGSELVQTFYLKLPGPNLVFAAPTPATLYFPDRTVFQLTDGTLRAGVNMEEGAVYTVVSHYAPVSADQLRTSDRVGPVPELVSRRYAQAPVITDRVAELARQVTASAPTTYDKVKALEAWMARNTRYSLKAPPLRLGADAVDQFLFEDRVGFCEQIGTSLVVMLRSLGIPARLAVGYLPGERNPFTGLYEVRASDAHSWAEVWFPGTGWQGFDPTASVPLAGDSEVSRASSGVLSYLAARLPRVPRWTVWAVGVVGGIGMAVAVARWCRGALAQRRRRRERSWADACLARLEEAGEASGRPRRPSETVREYTKVLRHSLADDRLVDVGEVVTRDAFSGRPAAEEERRSVEAVLEEVVAPAGRRSRR